MKGNEGKVENKMQKNVGAILRTCPQKGITLIALIITIIVMLILVGVTINVALNGGLFTTAQEAAKKTQKEAEREELMSIAIAAYNTKTGKVEKAALNLNGKYTEEQDKTTTDKVVVKGKSGTLWQIDINSAKVEEYNNGYTFTIGELVAMEGAEYYGDFWTVPFDNFWKEGVPEELKNSAQDFPDGLVDGSFAYLRFNTDCLDSTYTDYVDYVLGGGTEGNMQKMYVLWRDIVTGNILFGCWNEAGEKIDDENYTNYANLAFTISMPDGSTGGSGSSDAEVDETLARYLLGEGLGGRDYDEVITVDSKGNFIFKDDESTSDNEEETMGVQSLINTASTTSNGSYESLLYLKYNDKAYSIKIELKGGTLVTKKGTLSLVYEPYGREGQTYPFNGEQWTILYETEDYIEILSPNVLGNLDLRSTNSLENRIYNYNNAITLINQHCKDQISDDLANDNNVRSVGRATETTTMYTSTKYDLKNNGEGKDEDTDYLDDFIRMKFYGVDNAGDDYWIASRCIDGRGSDSVYYDVRKYEDSLEGVSQEGMWYSTTTSSNEYGHLDKYSVRPIVKIMK